MTNRKQALEELREKVTKGDCYFITSSIANVFGEFGPPNEGNAWMALSSHNGSLDAAKALQEAVLPNWDVMLQTYEDDTFEATVAPPLVASSYCGIASCMARSWLLAILKALIAQEGE